MLKPKIVAAIAATALSGACTQTANTPSPTTAAGPAAPNSSTVFTLALTPGSLSGCMLGNPGMDRPMTVTVAGGQATLYTSGGIHYGLDRVGPNLYHGGYYIDIRADLSAAPKRLTIINNDQTCTWTGTAA